MVGYLGLAVTAFAALAGAAAMVEMVYHLQLNAALGPELGFMGVRLNATNLNSWARRGFCAGRGLGLFELTRRRLRASAR